MNIIINGRNRNIKEKQTVDLLLAELNIPIENVAIEYNYAVLPKEHYADTVLIDGDRLEIVRFVGGG